MTSLHIFFNLIDIGSHYSSETKGGIRGIQAIATKQQTYFNNYAHVWTAVYTSCGPSVMEMEI